MALDMKISYLEVYGNSKLVINQLLTHYEVKHEGLISYFQMATRLIEKFDRVSLEHIPRNENRMADALANLATAVKRQMSLFATVGCSLTWKNM